MLNVLSRLVAARPVNPPGEEARAAEVLAAYLRKAGLAVEFQEVLPGRPNLLCQLSGRKPGRRLLFNSHLDVVPVGEPDRWSSDPFSATVVGGKLYGRGACDALGSVAAMAAAMVKLAGDGGPGQGELLFAAVMGEEYGSPGSKHLVASGLQADAAVVGEPTGLEVVLGHRGTVHLHVRVQGVSAHASNPDAGVNPTLKMARLLLGLEPYMEEVRERSHPLLGRPCLTPTAMATSPGSVAAIADGCAVTFDRWLLPGETPEAAAAEFTRRVERLCAQHDIVATVAADPRRRPCLVEPEAEIVRVAAQAVEQFRAARPALAGCTAATDAYIFMEAGIPTVALGPGFETGSGVHGIDEHVDIDQLLQAVEIYAALARQYLGEEGPN